MLMGNPPPPKKPCFAAGTLVTCKTGLKPIEQITVGEIVLSRNMKTGQNEWKTVTETFTNFANEFVQIELKGEIIKATGQHTFWLPKKNKWTKAIDLRTGDIFLTHKDEFKTITNVEIKKKKAATYNLEVEANHNYFVGQNQVLTHNKAKVSKFADATLYNVEFYNLRIRGSNVYVGQTVQGIFLRAEQHKYEGKRKSNWKKGINGVENLARFPEKVAVTAYEAAVIELYEIQLLRSKGGVVYNSLKLIGAKNFKRFKDKGNPCRLFT